jgi:hypothetical protein
LSKRSFFLGPEDKAAERFDKLNANGKRRGEERRRRGEERRGTDAITRNAF